MTGMTSARARRIMRALGWRYVDLQREMNRTAGTRYRNGDVWKWFSGTREVPLGVRIFLRMSLRLAVMRRRSTPSRIERNEQDKIVVGGSDRGHCVQLFARRLAAHAVAAMAREGVTYKLEVPPHDGFNRLAGAIGEWLENNADLATIRCDARFHASPAPETGPRSA